MEVELVMIILLAGNMLYQVARDMLARRPLEAIDDRAIRRIDDMQQNREYMAALERSYAKAGDLQQQTVNVLTGVLSILAPLTPGLKLDDKARDFLRDIQTPGAPPADPAAPPVGSPSSLAG